MTKEEFIAKLQMVYVGNKNAFNELIYAYSNLEQKNIELNNINDKLSNALNSAEQRIDKAIEYIKKCIMFNAYMGTDIDCDKLIRILQDEEVKDNEL